MKIDEILKIFPTQVAINKDHINLVTCIRMESYTYKSLVLEQKGGIGHPSLKVDGFLVIYDDLSYNWFEIEKFNEQFKLIPSNSNSLLLCCMESSDDLYTIITWPEVQELMDHIDFADNTCLINDGKLFDLYGSSAYFVNVNWLNKISKVEL